MDHWGSKKYYKISTHFYSYYTDTLFDAIVTWVQWLFAYRRFPKFEVRY